MQTRSDLIALALLTAVTLVGCASSQEGYERSEDVAEKIHATMAAVDEFSATRQASFQTMTELVSEPLTETNLRFDEFSADVDRIVAADAKLRSKVAKMKSVAVERFQVWGSENSLFSSQEMRVRTQENRDTARDVYREASDSVDALLERSTGLVNQMVDIRNALANDLTPIGLSTVSNFTENARVSNAELETMTRPTLTNLEEAANALSFKQNAL